MKIILDFPDWTYGQIERLEQAAGLSLAAIGQELKTGAISARTAAALIYAQEARTNPGVTLDDVKARPIGADPLELELPPAPLGSPETGE